MGEPYLVHEHVIRIIKAHLVDMLSQDLPPRDRALIGHVLRGWGYISVAIDLALINHKYKKLTFVIQWARRSRKRRDNAIFIEFVRDRLHKEWLLNGVRLKDRGGWPYMWQVRIHRNGSPTFYKAERRYSLIRQEVPI